MDAAGKIYLWLGCLAALVTGCERQPASPTHSITSIHMSGVYSQAARDLAVEFERQSGIHVTVVEAPFLSLREKELTDLLTQGGNYDVLQVAYQWEGEILPHLRPLDDAFGTNLSDRSDFIPTVINNCGRWDDHLYGWPMACNVITLFYRKDIFAARSADYQRLTGHPLEPPRTWPEYLQIARFLNSEDVYGNLLMGKEQTYTLWSGILYGMGGQLVDDQRNPVLNSEAGVRSLNLFVEMYRYAPLHAENCRIADADMLFIQGRGAMYLAWPGLLWPSLMNTNLCRIADKIGAAVIPGGKPQLSSWSLGISSNCRDPDAALKWIRFFVNRTNSKRLMLQYGIGSPRVSTYGDPECENRVFYNAQLLTGLANNEPRLRIPRSQEMSDYLDREIIKAIRGQTTPQAALDQTAAHWREILLQTNTGPGPVIQNEVPGPRAVGAP